MHHDTITLEIDQPEKQVEYNEISAALMQVFTSGGQGRVGDSKKKY